MEHNLSFYSGLKTIFAIVYLRHPFRLLSLLFSQLYLKTPSFCQCRFFLRGGGHMKHLYIVSAIKCMKHHSYTYQLFSFSGPHIAQRSIVQWREYSLVERVQFSGEYSLGEREQFSRESIVQWRVWFRGERIVQWIEYSLVESIVQCVEYSLVESMVQWRVQFSGKSIVQWIEYSLVDRVQFSGE